MAQLCNYLTLQQEQLGGQGSIKGRAPLLERQEKRSQARLGPMYFRDPNAWHFDMNCNKDDVSRIKPYSISKMAKLFLDGTKHYNPGSGVSSNKQFSAHLRVLNPRI